jgi:dipeptidyl aminopeptidase/acylaminoacyl peptidase
MARTPITAEDLYRFRWVDCVRLSADGAHVAWEVTWPDREERENRAAVWVADTSAGPGSAVTDEQGRKRSPAWSPDGTRLAYLSREGSVDQVRVLDLSEAAESVPRQLTSLEDGVLAHRWSPDGTRIAFLARVLSEPELVVEDPRPPEGKAVHRPPVARVVRGFDWRFNGVGPYDGRRVHLFWVRADGGGEPQQVTSGPWSVEGFDWAPDGSRLAITGDDQPGADLRRTRDAFVVDLETGVLNRVVRDRFTSSPRWSPDGAHLAWIGPTEPGAGFFNRVWVLPVEPAGAEPQCLTGGFDAHVGGGVIGDMRVSAGPGLRWDASGQRLYFLASARGAVNLYSVDLSGEVRAELGFAHRALFDFDLAAGRIGLAANDASQPGEVFVAEAGGVAERQVTDENSWLRQRALVTPEPQEFRAADGTRLEGWLLRPEAASEAAPAPLVLEIHGGPNGQYGWAFMQEFQLLAGQGIGVLYLNPRGSDGYGARRSRALGR